MSLAVGVASRGGFEPPACPLGGGRSIRLSYRDWMVGYFSMQQRRMG